MMDVETLKQTLKHPLAALAAAVGAVAALVQVPFLDAVLGTVWSNAGVVFALASVVSGALAEYLGLTPGMQAALILGAGGLYIGRLLDRLWTGVEKRRNDD